MIVSLDITPRHIFAVEAEYKMGMVRAVRHGCCKTPEACVVKGAVSKSGELAGAIRNLLSASGIRSKKAIVTVSNPAILFKELVIPMASPREIKAILQNEISQAIASRQDYIIDYIVTQTDIEQDGATGQRVMAIATPVMLVESYRSLLVKCGLKPFAFDVFGNVAYKIYQNSPSMAEIGGSAIIAQICQDQLWLTLVDPNGRMFCRNAVVNMNKTAEIDNEFVLSSFDVSGAEENTEALEKIIRAAADNISRLAQFQIIQHREAGVKRVYICADSTLDKSAAAKIQNATGFDTQYLDRPDFVKSADFDTEGYSVALGAAIRR